MTEQAKDDVGRRLRTLLRRGAPGRRSPELHDVVTDGCARVLVIETENLRLGKRISELAADADDPVVAQELRRLWVRRRTLNAELNELRTLLRQLATGTSRAPAG